MSARICDPAGLVYTVRVILR